jgi:uncharacterized protein YjbI with pentapeptide repeats
MSNLSREFSPDELFSQSTTQPREFTSDQLFQDQSTGGDSLGRSFDSADLFVGGDSVRVEGNQTLGREFGMQEVFPNEVPTYDEGLNRWQSGINSMLRSTSKALFKDLPQAAAILIHKTSAQSTVAGMIAQRNIERRKNGLPPMTSDEMEEFVATEKPKHFNYETLAEDPIYKFGQEMGRGAEELFPENPEFQGEFFAHGLPTATGQMLSMILTRGAGKVMPAAVGAAQISNNEFTTAMEKGATEDEAFSQFLITLPLGILEKLPVQRLLKRIDDMSGGGVKRWLLKTSVGSVEEAVQEVVEGIYTNTSANIIYDANNEVFDGIDQAARDGGGAAFILGGIANGLGVKLKNNRGKDGRVLDTTTEADMATIRSDVRQDIENNPDLAAEDLIDWERFEETARRQADPTRLKEHSNGSEAGDFQESLPPESIRLTQEAFDNLLELDGPVGPLLVDSELGGFSDAEAQILEDYTAGRRNVLNLNHTDMSDVEIAEDTILTSMKAEKSNWVGKELKFVAFNEADLSGANFSGTKIQNVGFAGANIRGIAFNDADLGVVPSEFSNTSMLGVDGHEASFNRSNLHGVEFTGATLSGASFINSRLTNVDFRSANLNGANLRGADLRGINFNELTRLNQTNLIGAKMDPGFREFAVRNGAIVEEGSLPFVVKSESVKDQSMNLMEEIKETFGVNNIIKILTVKDIRNGTDAIFDTFERSELQLLTQSDPKWRGGYAFIDGTHTIILNDLDQDVDSVRLLEALSHEAGHMVEKHLSMQPRFAESIEALKELHRKSVAPQLGMNLKEFLLNARLPTGALEMYLRVKQDLLKAGASGPQVDAMTLDGLRNFNPETFSYITSYSEWFADQFSRWAATTPTKRDTTSKVGRYMKAFAEHLKKMYDKFFKGKTFSPEPNFESWLKFITRDIAANPIEGAAVSGRVSGLKFSTDSPLEPSSDPEADFEFEGADDFQPRSYTINPDDIRFGEGTLRSAAWKEWLRWLAPRGRLDEQSFQIIQRERAAERREIREAFGRLNEVQTMLDEKFPDNDMTVEVEQAMDRILRGTRNEVVASLKDPVRSPRQILGDSITSTLLNARRHIDRLSMMLIREGVVEGRLALRIAANIGQYLHRSYRIHTDPKWAENVPPEVLKKAKAFVRERYGNEWGFTPTPLEVNNIIDTLLTNNDVQRSLLLGTKLSSQGLEILRPRKEVPAPIRALWGEIESPVYNYFESVRKISSLLSGHRATTQIRDAGKGIYFFESENMFHSRGYTQEIQAGVESPLRPLAGWKTHPEILRSLKDAFGQRELPQQWWLRGLLKMNGLVKLGKTALSPLTVMRNFYGGTLFLLANGHNPLRLVGRAPGMWKTYLDKGVNKDKLRWTELDLLDQSLMQGETLDALKDLNLQFDDRDLFGNLDPFRNPGFFKKLFAGTIRRATGFYNGIDSFLRISMFEMELEQQLKDSFPNTDPTPHQRRVLEEQVAQQVKDTYQNYSQVPRGIRALRQNVLVGPFVSFPYESIRTAFNTMSYARREMKSDNAAIRRRGYKRAFSLLATMSLGTTATLASMAWLGLSEDDEDDMNRFMPEWDKNVGKIFYDVKDGKPSYINVGYTFPYTIMEKPLLHMFLRGDEGLGQAFADAATDFFQNFLGTEITTQKALEFIANDNGWGGQIYNENAPWGEQFADAFAHFMDAFTPEVVDLTVVKPLTDPDFEPKNEALEIAFGLRRVELDINKSFGFKARNFHQVQKRGIRRFVNSVLFDEQSNIFDMDEAINKGNELYEEAWYELLEDYDAAVRQGVDPIDLELKLDEAGFSQKARKDLAAGIYRPLEFDIPQPNP